MTRRLEKSVFYDHPIDDVWTALTDPQALAEWLMPNDFKPLVGHRFRFQVDPMPGFSGINECEVLAVEPPHHLAYTWTPLPTKQRDDLPPPMTVRWRLAPERGGTRLTLEQDGLEHLNWWWRFSMSMGWGRRLKSLLPKVLPHIGGGKLRKHGINRRDYGTKTLPADFAK